MALLVAIGMFSCSTKKDKWANRTYHNITAKYNAYFNGREALKEGIKELEKKHEDNYFKVLNVYKMGSVEQSKGFYPTSEKVMKKAAKVIKKHSMMISGKERCKFIDDAYLLYGISNFYKRDYYAALEVFNYVAREAIKNTKRDNPQVIAKIWEMRAFQELGMYEDAQSIASVILNEKSLSRKDNAKFYTARTDFYLKQADYKKAIENAEEALKYEKAHANKLRLRFILAQLYQKTDELTKATQYYESALKLNPDYEMAVYARINIARCFDGNSSVKVRQVMKKMLNDPKNEEYYDQIHYAIGQLDEREGKVNDALKSYEKSIRASVKNNNQKGLSHIAKAEIFFTDNNFRQAATHYDTALTLISKDFPDYKTIESKKNSLADLMRQYIKIELYDSLVRVSKLSDAEIDVIIENLMVKAAEEEKIRQQKAEQAAKEAADRDAASNNTMGNAGLPSGTGAVWYFYNPAAMSFGFNEFKKVWGDRKLEDNWRRSVKQAVLPAFSGDPTANPDSVVQVATPKISKEDSIAAVKKTYLDKLPVDDNQRIAYTDSVIDAYYALGLIYKEQLKQLKQAAKVIQEMMAKYADNKYIPVVYYQLYRIYLAMPDEQEAEKYRSILLTRYGDSEYAQLIKDPEFGKKTLMNKKESEVYYDETYRQYLARNYDLVLSRCRTAEVKYSGNVLMPKFALLKALAIGQLRDVESFKSQLMDVIKTYPDDPVKTKATELLESLTRVQMGANAGGGMPKASVEIKYTYKADTTHLFAVWIKSKKANLNSMKNAVAAFNQESYASANLQISTMLVGANNQLLLVRNFSNSAKARVYLETIEQMDNVFETYDMDDIEVFYISPNNLTTVVKDQEVEPYFLFYKSVYR